MSNVPSAVTRLEKFLLGAATGDASGLPRPVTRSEKYLYFMAENGSGGGGSGTGDYNDLTNKPQINGVTLQGNKDLDALGLPDSPITSAELANMWKD